MFLYSWILNYMYKLLEGVHNSKMNWNRISMQVHKYNSHEIESVHCTITCNVTVTPVMNTARIARQQITLEAVARLLKIPNKNTEANLDNKNPIKGGIW